MAFISQNVNPVADIQAAIEENAKRTAEAVKWVMIIGVAVVLLYLATKK